MKFNRIRKGLFAVGSSVALLAVLAFSSPAAAHNQGNHESPIGAQGQIAAGGYAGAVTGSASSISSGNAIAATQVNGYGSSLQGTVGISGGTATVGGVVNHTGATVVTGTTQVAAVASYGNVTGNAPINVGDNMIANGTGGLAKSDNYASGNAAFATGKIKGFAGFQVQPIYAPR